MPDKAVNPFRFGALALDEAFADRDREVADLVADVRNGQDVVIFAPRRYGKSSLVWRASQELVSASVLIASVDLMTTPTKARLAEKLAASIYENVASSLERVRERALAPFRGLRIQPTVTVSPDDGSFSFSFGIAHQPADLDATLERLLARWYSDPRVEAAFQFTFHEDPNFAVGLVNPDYTREYPTYALWRAWGQREKPTDPAPPLPAGCR
jgi:hypothetical protein